LTQSAEKVSFVKMNSSELDECFEFVHALVVKCGETLKEGFKNTGVVTTKGAAHDLVTFWDNEIEKILIEKIKQKYPEHK
jgi:fructose-1,6-bisphosphatase/inositol monophosphatase family enzyme